MNWKHLFQTYILERGFNYHESGAVVELVKTPTGYFAVVEGTRDYRVEIETYNGEVTGMECSCPYSVDGAYCKHMAAVLYEIDEPDNENDLRLSDSNELEQTVNQMSETDLRKMIIDLARKDTSLANRILVEYSASISTSQMIQLKSEVDEIVSNNSSRDGFIDWYHASDFTYEMDIFIEEKVQLLMEKGYYLQAFEMINYALQSVCDVDMDDSDGGTTEIANTCYDCWKQLLKMGSEEEKQTMLQWFIKHQQVDDPEFVGDYVREFLVNEFHEPKMLQLRLEELDERIEHATDENDCGNFYSSRYGYVNTILKRLEIMHQLKYSERQIEEYKQKHRNFWAIRELEIQKDIEQEHYEDAISVLNESKQLDHKNMEQVKKYSRQLIDIYEKIGQDREYKEELLYQVFSCNQSDLTYINQLKSACNSSDWIKYREELLELKTVWGIRYELLEKEGLYDQLLKELLDKEDIITLDRYEKVLKKRFPEKVCNGYISYVMNQAQRACDRNGYRYLMQYLKKIVTYSGGKDKAVEIAEAWKKEYRRRPAMMDELRKAGF